MFKFKPLNVLVDAIQWKNGQLDKPESTSVPDWIRNALNETVPGAQGSLIRCGFDVHVFTPVGHAVATDGDWIVRDESGDLMVWKDYAFRRHFTPDE